MNSRTSVAASALLTAMTTAATNPPTSISAPVYIHHPFNLGAPQSCTVDLARAIASLTGCGTVDIRYSEADGGHVEVVRPQTTPQIPQPQTSRADPPARLDRVKPVYAPLLKPSPKAGPGGPAASIGSEDNDPHHVCAEDMGDNKGDPAAPAQVGDDPTTVITGTGTHTIRKTVLAVHPTLGPPAFVPGPVNNARVGNQVVPAAPVVTTPYYPVMSPVWTPAPVVNAKGDDPPEPGFRGYRAQGPGGPDPDESVPVHHGALMPIGHPEPTTRLASTWTRTHGPLVTSLDPPIVASSTTLRSTTTSPSSLRSATSSAPTTTTSTWTRTRTRTRTVSRSRTSRVYAAGTTRAPWPTWPAHDPPSPPSPPSSLETTTTTTIPTSTASPLPSKPPLKPVAPTPTPSPPPSYCARGTYTVDTRSVPDLDPQALSAHLHLLGLDPTDNSLHSATSASGATAVQAGHHSNDAAAAALMHHYRAACDGVSFKDYPGAQAAAVDGHQQCLDTCTKAAVGRAGAQGRVGECVAATYRVAKAVGPGGSAESVRATGAGANQNCWFVVGGREDVVDLARSSSGAQAERARSFWL